MSKPQFKIVSFPEFNSVAPGALVNLRSELINDDDRIPNGTRFHWSCYNDPATTPWYQPSRVFGPMSRHWENARWSFTGLHTIVLTVTFPDGTKQKYLRKQRVDNATNILRREFDPAANDFDPTPIQTLENTRKYLAVLKKIAAEKPPATEQDKEKHETTVKNLDAYIFHLDDHLKGLEHKEAYQVDAIHIDVERSTRTVLKLWLIHNTAAGSDEKTWRLIDWTNPAHQSTTGSYEQSGDTHQEAIENLLENWDDNNRYPEGRIRYKFRIAKYNIHFEDGFDTDGMSTWDEISKWLDYVALGAAVVAGVATLIAPIPGSRVVSAAIWTSIVTSTGAATINIAQRHSEGFGNLKDDAFDGLTIVGNLFAGAGTYWKVGASVTSATRLGSGMSKAIIIGQIGTDGLQGVLLAAEHISQYNQIMDDPDLLPEDRLKKLMELFRSAAISGAMTYIAVKGSTADLDNLNNNRTLLKAAEVELPTTTINLDAPIEHSVPVREQQTQVKTRTEIEPETRQLDEGPGRTKLRLAKAIENKFVNPDTFEEAKELLNRAQEALKKGGKPLKYSDAELQLLLENPKIKDRFIVRFMEAKYMDAPKRNPDGSILKNSKGETVFEKNGGKLGQIDEATGAVKYWSTTFDQIVQCDHDADLIRRTVGMGMNYFKPDKKYALLLIDRTKHEAKGVGTTIIPTYKNLGDFAVAKAKSDPTSEALIRKVMTEEYSAKYLNLRAKADAPSGKKDPDGWDIPMYNLKDNEDLADFLEKHFLNDPNGRDLFLTRLNIEFNYGAYDVYTGNGLTMSLNKSNGRYSEPNEYGVKETFTFETKPMTIKEMIDADMLDYIELNPALGKGTPNE